MDQEDVALRGFSPIIFLRSFNNWIKSMLINKYCDSLDFKSSPSVLDLCSGKGGDLNKWIRRKPSHYVAMEYQGSLIEKAMKRLQNYKKLEFPSIFVVHDAGDPNTLLDHVFNTHEAFKDIR